MHIRVLYTKQEIDKRVQELAERLKKDYDEVHVVCILEGAFVFCADLVRAMHGPKITIDFLSAKSYQDTESTGDVRIEHFTGSVQDKDVLIVEDIVDTGLTIKQVVKLLEHEGAKSVKVCTLLDKPSKRKTNIQLDYVGFEIPNNFVVGYGLDHDDLYRELDYIGMID